MYEHFILWCVSAVVTNIASLVLGYDMRRLNDLTEFRRCWYRTSLIESFIGSKKPHLPEGGGGEQEEAVTESNTGNEECIVDNMMAHVHVASPMCRIQWTTECGQQHIGCHSGGCYS